MEWRDHVSVDPVVCHGQRRPRFHDYSDRRNPPILHRKETFLHPDHPLYGKFARLTRSEEAKGLYEDTRRIGTRDGWSALLADKALDLRGHRLLRTNSRRSPAAPVR